MATVNYSWNLPVVGGSEDTWGTDLNANWTALDTLLGGTNATEFAILDGATVSTAELNLLDGVTWTLTDLNSITAAGLALLDDADAAAQRATLELVKVTSAEWRDNTADRVLITDDVWSAMAEVTLTDVANIALDLSTGFDFTVTLAGNRTLNNPTNAKVGQRGRIRVVQDGTGSRTLSFGSNYEFVAGTAPTLTTTASAEDVLYYDVISSTRILITMARDIS